MSRWLVPALLGAAAAATGARALGLCEHALAHPSLRAVLIALYVLLRTLIAAAFAILTINRAEPQRRSREPLAFLACAAAILLVIPLGGTASRSSTALVLAGDLLAACACVWLLASVLVLGRCFGILPEARGLITRGPYRLIRHPVYLGEITALAGLTLASPSVLTGAVLTLVIGAQSVRMRLEERALRAAFPDYAEYAARTGALLPQLRRAQGRIVMRSPAPSSSST